LLENGSKPLPLAEFYAALMLRRDHSVRIFIRARSIKGMSLRIDPLPQLDSEQWPRGPLEWADIDADEHPIIDAINRIAILVAEALGPVLWAILILLFIWAELASN
jgi:hypothetical protein